MSRKLPRPVIPRLPRPVAMKRVLFEGELKRNQGSYYSILEITEGASLVVTLTGTGNVDLYVKRGAKPTIYSFDAKSTGPTPSERLQVRLPEGGGTYYLRLRPIASTSTVRAVATVYRDRY
jgi:bacterial leucyl aminopeptidase